MNTLRIITLTLLTSIVAGFNLEAKDRVILVKAGDVNSLMDALLQAGEQNASPKSKRLVVLIPNGVYDFGEKALTTVTGYNISLVGESTEGTIIVNAPKVENEGISTTATLLNRGQEIYVQDLTLRNDLDYYNSGPAGRAVCWQDKGQHTIFKRVRFLSYQDTYYSHSEECSHYFEDCEIHGTVDFICGAGDVYFNRCTIVTEKRNLDGSGNNVIAAPRTSTTQWGYVFDHCTIRNDVSSFGLARAWHTHPRCAWLYTRLETPEKMMPTRFDPVGIRTTDVVFYEYGTTDANGNDITPASNVVAFEVKEEHSDLETIITKEEADRFTVENVFPTWRPDKRTRRIEKQCKRLKEKYFGSPL